MSRNAERTCEVWPDDLLPPPNMPPILPKPAVPNGAQPTFVMRWQDSDPSRLPKNLLQQLSSKRFHEAAVGSCQPSGDAGTFTAYRIAVLLY